MKHSPIKEISFMTQKKPRLTPYQKELYLAARRLSRLADEANDEIAGVLLYRAANLLRKYARRSPAERVAEAVRDGCYQLDEIRKETKLSHRLVKISLQYLLTLNKITVRQRLTRTKGRPQKLYVPRED